MVQPRAYRAFFSYARADAAADPKLIEALTKDLEERVNIKLLDDRFEIWRDTERLRLGDNWEPKLEAELRRSDILIVLLTPRWLGSAVCRREYELFEEVETERTKDDSEVGYVALIQARDIEKEASRLPPAQDTILYSLKKRQYQRLLAVDFLQLSKSKRTLIVDGIADDIHGLIERRRTTPDRAPAPLGPGKKSIRKREYDLQALNYEDVDFVSNAEVLLDRAKVTQPAVYAQVDFVHRLYIDCAAGRIEFGVRRAYLRIMNDGPGKLVKTPELKGSRAQNVAYVSLHEAPGDITVCIDPAPGKPALAELALPPTENENYWSKLATTTHDVATDKLSAELQVSLSTEGLYLTAERLPSQRTLKHLQAIVDIVLAKSTGDNNQTVGQGRKLRRKVKVTDRT